MPFLSIGVVLALCVAPVLLLRRPDRRVSGGVPGVPQAIVRNAWIASGLRLSAFAALFALGAAGDLLPALAAVLGFAAGLCLLGAIGRRLASSPDEAHRRERPATPHALTARGGGLRVSAALIAAVALIGLAGAEAAAFVVVTTPVVGGGSAALLFATLFVAAFLYAVPVGERAVRYVSQALLGAIFFGLFGALAFLLYLSAADLRPLPPHGAFALIALVVCCVAVLAYRQTKYVETPLLAGPEEASRWRRIVARAVRVVQRLANVGISVLAVTAVVLAGMQFYFLGLTDLLRSGVAALAGSPSVPALGLVGIALLALACPLVDAVGWRSVGALAAAPDAAPGGALRPLRSVAGETAMFGILMAAFGAIAALSTDLPSDSSGMVDFVAQLIAFDHGITDAALTLLVAGFFALALAAMGMGIATAVTVIRAEVLPALRPATHEAAGADREAKIATAAIGIVIAAIWIASGVPSSGILDMRFFAMVLAFAALQLSLVPVLAARCWATAPDRV